MEEGRYIYIERDECYERGRKKGSKWRNFALQMVELMRSAQACMHSQLPGLFGTSFERVLSSV